MCDFKKRVEQWKPTSNNRLTSWWSCYVVSATLLSKIICKQLGFDSAWGENHVIPAPAPLQRKWCSCGLFSSTPTKHTLALWSTLHNCWPRAFVDFGPTALALEYGTVYCILYLSSRDTNVLNSKHDFVTAQESRIEWNKTSHPQESNS